MFTVLLRAGHVDRPWPLISSHGSIQALYERMRCEGQSHNLAEMFAFQAPPMSDSDREFLEGRNDNSEQARLGQFAEQYRTQAARAGVDTKGRVYQSGLALFPGDPKAWVANKGEVKRVCEERNFGCEGAVSHKIDNSLPECPGG